MKGAGKDCSALFVKYHAWVNIDGLLTKCLLGYLVDDASSTIEEEDEGKKEGDTDVDMKNTMTESEAVVQELEKVDLDNDRSSSDDDTATKMTSTLSDVNGNSKESASLLPPQPPTITTIKLSSDSSNLSDTASSRARVVRINPGLQNIAAGGTVHDARANDISTTTTSSSGGSQDDI